MTNRLSATTFALCIAGWPAAKLEAAVSIGSTTGSYSQNFDSLASAGTTHGDTGTFTNNSTLDGWYYQQNGGTESLIASNGSSGQQDRPLSLGTDGSNERALGSQSANGTSTIHFGLLLTNNSGATINSFKLDYTGEQWREVSGEGLDKLQFSYGTFSSGTGSLSASGYTDESNLDFTAPHSGGSSTQYNGNLAANRVIISYTVNGVNWQAGEELWLRWSDITTTNVNRRAQMGVDDLTFTAVPEPSSLLLVSATAGLVCAGYRRRS